MVPPGTLHSATIKERAADKGGAKREHYNGDHEGEL